MSNSRLKVSDRILTKGIEFLDGAGSILALMFLRVSIFLSILVMIALLCIGFKELFCAMLSLFHGETAHKALCEAIHGIEYFLLSPLSFLVINAVLNYVATMLKLTPESQSENDEIRARIQLLTAKSFIISLLAATVATFLVGKVISPGPSDTEQIIIGGGVLIILILLLVIVERNAQTAQSDNSPKHIPSKENA